MSGMVTNAGKKEAERLMASADPIVGRRRCEEGCPMMHDIRLSDLSSELQALAKGEMAYTSELWQDGAVTAAIRNLKTTATDFAESVKP